MNFLIAWTKAVLSGGILIDSMDWYTLYSRWFDQYNHASGGCSANPKVVRLFSKQNLGLYIGAASPTSSHTYDIPFPFRGFCLRRRSNECSSYHLIGVAVHTPHLFSAVIFFPILFSSFFFSCIVCIWVIVIEYYWERGLLGCFVLSFYFHFSLFILLSF